MVDSSTIAAFCCVILSIWPTAMLISCRPVDCSRADDEIDEMCSLIAFTCSAISSSALPVSRTSETPLADTPDAPTESVAAAVTDDASPGTDDAAERDFAVKARIVDAQVGRQRQIVAKPAVTAVSTALGHDQLSLTDKVEALAYRAACELVELRRFRYPAHELRRLNRH